MRTISRQMLERRDAGYEIWRERSLVEFDVEVISYGSGDPQETVEVADEMQAQSGKQVVCDVAYNLDGDYIGDLKTAEFLCDERGIRPEVIPGNSVCSIGFCEREQKWYGWCHRAIFGFGVGDTAKEGDCVCSSGWTEDYLAENPDADRTVPVGFEAKTLEDAKRMAIAFADSVG